MLIVHIEDESLLRDILRRGFRHADVPVDLHQFESGDDSLPFIRDHVAEIDLFILDIRLPGTLNGIQIAQRLREMGCPGSIVLTSAYYSSPDPNWLTALNVQYLPKPWYVFEIAKKLRTYCLDTPPEPAADSGESVETTDSPTPVLQPPSVSALLKGKNGTVPDQKTGEIIFSVNAGEETVRHEREELLESLLDETRPRRPMNFPFDAKLDLH
jgi:DNA-binding LytR/AlgR family response regulator